jgi:superfamily II DNA/RNA helicase
MLLDGSYLRETERILEHLKLIRRRKIKEGTVAAHQKTYQSILSAASLPTYGLKSIEKIATQYFPLAHYIRTDYMHQHHPMIKQEFIELKEEDIEYNEYLMNILFQKLEQISENDRKEAMEEELSESNNESDSPGGNERKPKSMVSRRSKNPYPWITELNSSVMIFFNTAQKAHNFFRELESNGIPAVEMHSLIKRELKEKNLRLFQQQKVPILICTDSCARGFDFPFVKYVFQGEFASNVVQYLHRIGRASRAGKEGIAINYYSPVSHLLVDSILGKKNYNMNVTEGAEEDKSSEETKKPMSTIEQSFSRRRGLRHKYKKQNVQSKQ